MPKYSVEVVEIETRTYTYEIVVEAKDEESAENIVSEGIELYDRWSEYRRLERCEDDSDTTVDSVFAEKTSDDAELSGDDN